MLGYRLVFFVWGFSLAVGLAAGLRFVEDARHAAELKLAWGTGYCAGTLDMDWRGPCYRSAAAASLPMGWRP
jgi:hypothetical protein